jgi:hypothetical protein
MGKKIPAGTYTLYLINQSYTTQVADVSLNVYWQASKGTITKKA